MNRGEHFRLASAKEELASILAEARPVVVSHAYDTFSGSIIEAKTTAKPGYDARIAELRAIIARIEGIPIYHGAERQVVPALNARDMINHSGWSLEPTPEWREANSPLE